MTKKKSRRAIDERPNVSHRGIEHGCKLPDGERCEAAIEREGWTSIQRIHFPDHGRCTRRHKVELANKNGDTMRFCAVHARMALEGSVDSRGDVLSKNSRNDISRYRLGSFHGDEWSEVVTPEEIQKALNGLNERQRAALLDLGSAHGATLNALVRRGLINLDRGYDFTHRRYVERYARTALGQRVRALLQKAARKTRKPRAKRRRAS